MSSTPGYQHIIDQQPEHTWYAEPFLGRGAVMRHKEPAQHSVGIDLDQRVIRWWKHLPERIPNLDILKIDAFDWLEHCTWSTDGLIYIDPPRIRIETAHHHARLLELAMGLTCQVQITGRRCDLYDQRLRGWRRIDYCAARATGNTPESLWCNYPESDRLREDRLPGPGNGDRQRIERLKMGWGSLFAALSAAERSSIAEALFQIDAV